MIKGPIFCCKCGEKIFRHVYRIPNESTGCIVPYCKACMDAEFRFKIDNGEEKENNKKFEGAY